MAQSVRSFGKSALTIDEVREQLELRIVEPQDNDNYFANIIGNRDIITYFSQVASDYNNDTKDGQAELSESDYHPSFILIGAEGIGKTLTAFSFAKEVNLPILIINTENLFVDFSRKMFQGIKSVIESIAPCVVLVKDLNNASQLTEENQGRLYTELKRLKNTQQDSFFFVSFSATTAYPSFFVSEDGFDTSLSYNPPDPKEREELIKRFIAKYPHDPK